MRSQISMFPRLGSRRAAAQQGWEHTLGCAHLPAPQGWEAQMLTEPRADRQHPPDQHLQAPKGLRRVRTAFRNTHRVLLKKPHCSLKANGNIITHPARSAGTFYRVMIRNNQVKLIKQRVEIVQPVFLCLHCPTAVPSHLLHQQGHRHTGPAGTQPRDQWPAHQATKLFLRLPSTHRSLGLLHPWGCHTPRDLQGGTSSLQNFYPSAKLAWVGHGWPGRTVNTALPLSHARLGSIFSPFFLLLPFFLHEKACWRRGETPCYIVSEKHPSHSGILLMYHHLINKHYGTSLVVET